MQCKTSWGVLPKWTGNCGRSLTCLRNFFLKKHTHCVHINGDAWQYLCSRRRGCVGISGHSNSLGRLQPAVLVLLCSCAYVKPQAFVSDRGGLGCKWVLFCTAVITMRHHSEALKNIFSAGMNTYGPNRGMLLFHGLGSSGSEVWAGSRGFLLQGDLYVSWARCCESYQE